MRRVLTFAVVAFLLLSASTAWGYWSASSLAGGGGAAAASTVNPGATPTATVVGRAITVSWAASTLANGQAVTGYLVKRYDASTLAPQAVLTGCAGTITATSCVENGVPAGQWAYSVTPLFDTNWQGPQSVRSIAATVAAPTLSLSPATVKPGASLTGTAAGFLGGETLRYRLDSRTGTVLTGSLAGAPTTPTTPATVPSGGGGSVVVTVPSGTTDGAHTINAVASPSGDAASTSIVVDGTAPPLPVLTLTPTAVSGDAVTFAYTESESSATVECQLDGAGFAPCDSPVDYAGLSTGSHTFQARATDAVGNVGAATSYTWTVNLTIPTIAIAFPTVAGLYNDSGFKAGCGTTSTGDVCGTADDDTAVTAVNVSLRSLSTGLWWNGTTFSATAETFVAATGTTDWTYAISATALAEGDFTLRAQVSDGPNSGYDSRTFTIDRTAPAMPSLTTAPPATSGPTATFAFTTNDATAVFECRLDAGAWTSCSSPRTYDTLAHGSHTVNIRAIDGAGNTSAATTTTWTVDATAPTATMAFPTATSYNLVGWAAGCGTPGTGDVCGTAADVGSGLTSVSVSIRRAGTNSYWDGTAFAAASETWLDATGTMSWSYNFAGASFPADGAYTVRWRATDAVGTTTIGGTDLTLDTAPPPAPVIIQTPSNPSGASAQLDFTDAEAGTGAECRLDAGAWGPCTSPVGYSGLSAGSHTFSVRATDAAGNTSAAVSYTWTVDVGVPSIDVSFPTAGGTYSDTTYDSGCGTPSGDICGTASDAGGNVAAVAVSIQRASTSLYWNGTSFASVTEVFRAATGTTTWSYAMTAASLPEGSYTVRARATDNVGLTGFNTRSLALDRTAPTSPTIISGPTGTTNGSADSFSFSGEAGATFQCRLDAGAWATCISPRTYGALTNGSHTFDVRALDGAGNVGATASRAWTVDATGPSVGTTFPGAGGRYGTTSYNAGCANTTGDVCGTASDAVSGVAKVEISVQRATSGLYLSGTSFTSASQNWITATGTTSWSYLIAATVLSTDGAYTLSVRATDAVGNTTTTSTVFVIDKTKPTGAGFTTTNAGTARKLELNDTYTLTYSEAMDPALISAGWNGLTTQNVVVRATNNSTSDKLTVYNATNTTLLPLGTLTLKSTTYVTAAMTFGLSGTPSTLTMSGSSVTITLGNPSSTANTTAAAAVNMSWAPATGAKDLAGNAATTAAYVENDLDNDF
jgi:hypothetical protein